MVVSGGGSGDGVRVRTTGGRSGCDGFVPDDADGSPES